MYIMQNNKCSHLFQICDKQFYWVFPLTFQRTCDILSCVNVFVLYINTKREGPFSQYPTDIPRMKAALVLSVFIAQAFGQTAECNPPLPSECGETDIRWDSSNLLFLPHLLNQVVTWEHMRTVGWETSVCPRVPSVLPPAPPPPPLPGRRGDVRHGNFCWRLLAGRLLHGRGIRLSICVLQSSSLWVCSLGHQVRIKKNIDWFIFFVSSCDMGTHEGCWLGDFCMPEGSICPPTSETPSPSEGVTTGHFIITKTGLINPINRIFCTVLRCNET